MKNPGGLGGWWELHVLPRAIGCACGAKPIAKQRAKIVPKAEGVVVDVGFGSGANLPFLDRAKVTRLIAVEPSAAMLDWHRDRRRADLPVEEFVAGGEATGLPDAVADTVLFTYALCTIPDPHAALREAGRILKPQGRILFCEHGLSPDPGVARFQRFIEPAWKRFSGGCHVTRDPLALLGAAGFACAAVDTMHLPGTPRFAGYNAWGVATLRAGAA